MAAPITITVDYRVIIAGAVVTILLVFGITLGIRIMGERRQLKDELVEIRKERRQVIDVDSLSSQIRHAVEDSVLKVMAVREKRIEVITNEINKHGRRIEKLDKDLRELRVDMPDF